ncbi:MAG: TetR/AcrR family transcriptional regulator [Actinobacteria bacterium]|nr:TetR/AcrR family transcriptional regulator [Actinomycetota bacterium]OPZ75950.1 MAG: transcriptional regulator BetI [Actinobacteria bacterium ADurb.Bin444]
MFADNDEATDNTDPISADAPGARRRERQRQAVRRELLQVARELMLEVGPDNVTLREVARRADFSPAAIYTYFANRDAIILALMEDSFRRLDEYVRRVPRNSSPDRRVIEFCLAYMDFGRENPADLRSILAANSLDLPEGVDPSLGLEAARLIGETFREGMQQGVFRAHEGLSASEMAYQLWALVHGMTVLEGIDLTMVSGEISATPRRIIEAFVEGLKAK